MSRRDKQVSEQQGYNVIRREAKRLRKAFNWPPKGFIEHLKANGWNQKPGRYRAIIKDINKPYGPDNIFIGTMDEICEEVTKNARDFTRRCKTCKVIKTLDHFSKDKALGHCRKIICYDCVNKAVRSNEDAVARRNRLAKIKRRSYEGCKKDMYHHMQCSSRDRGHPKPAFTFDEFDTWLEDSGYRNLYILWVGNGYQSSDKPSVDRIDINKGYRFGNMRLVTWSVNRTLEGVRKRVEGQKVSDAKYIKRTNKDTGEVTIYDTTKLAAYDNNTSHATISRLCNKQVENTHLTRNYHWEYCNKDGGPYVELDKTVCQLDMKGNILGEYESAAIAARELGLDYKSINRVLTKKRPNYGGYLWKYKRDT